MKIAAALIIAMTITVPAMAQTFQVSPRYGNGMLVQGDDGSFYNYSFAPDGSYIVQKQGESGHYQAGSPNSGNGYLIQGVDGPKWSIPVIIPPQQ